MKRFLTAALILGVTSTFGLVGCGEQPKEQPAASGTGGTPTPSPEPKAETPGTTPAPTPVAPAK